MSIPSSGDSLLRLGRDERRLLAVQRFLIWVLPILFVLVVWDLVHWGVDLQRPARLILPDLEPIFQPLPAAPSVEFSATLFNPLREEPSPQLPATERERVWILRGVMLSGNKRAFLEDPESGQTLWVREGEKVGGAEVKTIQERTVILMRGDKAFELQM
jgi:hypothetical protein